MHLLGVLGMVALFGCVASMSSDGTPPSEIETIESEVEVIRAPVLTPEAVIPSQDPSLRDVEVHPDRLVFIYRAAGSTGPAVGSVVAGEEGGGYLRRVLDVRQETPTRFAATTELAQLTDLFEDVHFIATVDTTRAMVADGGEVGRREDALSANLKLIPDARLRDFLGGCGLSEDNVSLGAELSTQMEVEIDISRAPGFIPRPQLDRARFDFSGELKAFVEVRLGNLTIECPLFEFENARLFSARSVFAVGFVPVVIRHDLGAGVKLEAGISINAGDNTIARAEGGYRFETGLSYDRDTGWTPRSERGPFGSATLETEEHDGPPTIEISATLTPSISYTPKLYELLGPKLSLKPSVTGRFQANGTCDYEVEVTGNLAFEGEMTLIDIETRWVEFDVGFGPYSVDLFGARLYPFNADEPHRGRFPWCDEGPDPCAEHDSCGECNNAVGCGWCQTAGGSCMSDSRSESCGEANWLTSPSSCEPCNGFGSCDLCVRNGFCGWCPGSGCVNLSAPAGLMCEDVRMNPGSCG